MANADDEWGLGSGLALDGATVEVTGAEFGFNANIGAGIVCLNLTMTDEDGEEIDQSFSCGNKFEASKDGNELVGAGKIIKNSNYGHLLQSLAACVDDVSELGLDPRLASTWVGLQLTFGTVTLSTTNPTTGVTKDSDKFIVTEYHGRAEDAAPAPAAKKASGGAAKKAASGGGSKAAAKSSGIPDGIDQEVWDELIALANDSEDYETFATAALELDSVDGNRAAQKAIMSTKPGSVWATAKGDE